MHCFPFLRLSRSSECWVTIDTVGTGPLLPNRYSSVGVNQPSSHSLPLGCPSCLTSKAPRVRGLLISSQHLLNDQAVSSCQKCWINTTRSAPQFWDTSSCEVPRQGKHTGNSTWISAMRQFILHRPGAPAILTDRSHRENQHLAGRSPQGAGPPTGWTRPLGPSFLTTPLLRLKRFSISPSLAPRSRMTSTSRIMPDVRNLLPCPPDSPRLSNSSSASRASLSRASSAERTALLDGDGNTGAPECSWAVAGCDVVLAVVGDAVDEGEYVGLGWTTPICRSRSARPGWRLSAGFGDMCGSEPSRRIAVHTLASLAAALPIGPGPPVGEGSGDAHDRERTFIF